MCGIFGIVTTKHRDQAIEPLNRAMRSLAHRGPDDQGIDFLSGEGQGLTVAFAHRRLAILDLSPAGHQPMKDERTGNWITYNGEVFNFHELRRTLQSQGISFSSESDTEVLLKGLGARGIEAIADWRGMFACGFWDAQKHRLSLIRDRLGIKPLYYFQDQDSFIFSSEIRAMLASGLVPRKLSRTGIESFLACGSVQQPLTIIDNVFALLPGHILTFEKRQVRTSPYWELRAEPADRGGRSEDEMSEEIAHLLLESVKYRLVSDVPVGVFLSGGIDSSSIVALMRQATVRDIKSFSVCFSERDFDERAYAERVARHYNTDHHSILLSEGEILARLPAALRAMDQPSIDGINSFTVSEAAARAGLKVALTGLGGDEVFAGYSYFPTIERSEKLRMKIKSVPLALRRPASAAIRTILTTPRATKLCSLLCSKDLEQHSVCLHRRLFTKEQQLELLKTNGQHAGTESALEEWTARQFVNCANADPINQASALDLGGYLSNTLLRDIDAMSMAHSLEVRVPLIDHKLVEAMLSIPGPIKLRRKEPKWMLINAARDLPRAIIGRPKRGFELPFKFWLRGNLREQVENTLHSPTLIEQIEPGSIERIWQSFIAEKTTWSRVWSLFVLGEWMQLNLKA